MEKLGYYLRVFIISYEFLVLVVSFIIYLALKEYVLLLYQSQSFDENAVKWLALYPCVVFAWLFKEGKGVIFPGADYDRLLSRWPDYGKLKIHFNVGLFNSILFMILCLIIFFLGKMSTFNGMWLFITFSISTSVNALTFYLAKISIKSILLTFDG